MEILLQTRLVFYETKMDKTAIKLGGSATECNSITRLGSESLLAHSIHHAQCLGQRTSSNLKKRGC